MPCCPTSLATGRTAPGTYHSGIPSTPKEPARVGSGLSKYTPVRFHVVFPSVTVKLPVSRYSGSTASIQHLLGHAVVDEALLDGQGLGIDLGVRTEAGEVVRPRHAVGVLADLIPTLVAHALALSGKASSRPESFDHGSPDRGHISDQRHILRSHARLGDEARLTLPETQLSLAALHALSGPGAVGGGQASRRNHTRHVGRGAGAP